MAVRVTSSGLVLYRNFNPGDTRQVTTGDKEWDSYLFAASTREAAAPYGSATETIELTPSAKVLYEGSAKFRRSQGWRRGESMLDWAKRVVAKAKTDGYDAVHFERQSDIGTVIINRQAIASRHGDPLVQQWLRIMEPSIRIASVPQRVAARWLRM